MTRVTLTPYLSQKKLKIVYVLKLQASLFIFEFKHYVLVKSLKSVIKGNVGTNIKNRPHLLVMGKSKTDFSLMLSRHILKECVTK